jgi:hypothetical protein
LVALFIPVSKVPLKKIKFDDDLDKIWDRLKNPVLSNSFIFLVYTKISIVSYTDLRIKNTEKWQNIEHKWK